MNQTSKRGGGRQRGVRRGLPGVGFLGVSLAFCLMLLGRRQPMCDLGWFILVPLWTETICLEPAVLSFETNMKVFAASFVAEIFLGMVLSCGQAFCADPFEVADVYVSCACQDAVGANLCLALKEKIKRSSRLRLVPEERQTGGVAIHLVCTEEDGSGLRTTGPHAVAAVVLTMFAGDQEYYESLEIIKVGPRQNDILATSIVSQIEEMATRNSLYAPVPSEGQ